MKSKLITQAVIQGEYAVSGNPDVVFTTVLGSCVAVCLHDPVAGVGGMNHYLLPGSQDNQSCGLNMMELLINGLYKIGAQRSRLRAKVFGGAHITKNLPGIGSENIEFARMFLKLENIPCLAECLGGSLARNVRYMPESGKARLKRVSNVNMAQYERRLRIIKPKPIITDDVVFF